MDTRRWAAQRPWVATSLLLKQARGSSGATGTRKWATVVEKQIDLSLFLGLGREHDGLLDGGGTAADFIGSATAGKEFFQECTSACICPSASHPESPPNETFCAARALIFVLSAELKC